MRASPPLDAGTRQHRPFAGTEALIEGASEADTRHRWLMGAIFTLGAALRVALTWSNPPYNAWDNHFEPIFLLLTQGAVPPKFACFECYHPPVFYAVSAAVAWVVSVVGLGGEPGFKILQYLNCVFGVAALLATLAIVERVRVPRSARLAAALVIAVLPRHIYVSAAHGNDSLAILLVTVIVWMLMTLGDGRASLLRYAALGGVASLAIFTKYNALIVLPGIALALATLPALRAPAWRGAAIGRAMLALGVPALLLAANMASNVREYGAPLPGGHEYARHNPEAEDFVARQPRDRRQLDFIAFTPWRFVVNPLLRPGQLNEFWTVTQASVWFDNDARFVQLLAPLDWRRGYYGWLRGDVPFTDADPGPQMRFALLLGGALGVLGLGMLATASIGGVALLLAYRRDYRAAANIVPCAGPIMVMAALNVAGIAYWAATRVPLYSAMKSSYLLPSTAATAILLAVGFSATQKRRGGWFAALCAAGLISVLVAIHVGQLAFAVP